MYHALSLSLQFRTVALWISQMGRSFFKVATGTSLGQVQRSRTIATITLYSWAMRVECVDLTARGLILIQFALVSNRHMHITREEKGE